MGRQLGHMQDSAVVSAETVELGTGCCGSSAAGPHAGFIRMLDLAKSNFGQTVQQRCNWAICRIRQQW